MAPWLYRCEAAETMHALDENVIGPEAPLGSEHNALSRGQTRGLAKWLQQCPRALWLPVR